MPTELAETVADDTTLPLFAIPTEIRQWGARARLAERDAGRATAMLVGTGLFYAAFIVLGESIDRWWGWCIAWIGLVMAMMRIDAIHHEAIHRSLYAPRWLNDVIAGVTGAWEGFHGPMYRCFHLGHHALTRRDDAQSDPEDFYDEVLTRPFAVGSLRIPARVVFVGGMVVGGISFALQLVVGAIRTLLGRPPGYVGAASLQRHVRRWGFLPFGLWTGAIALAVFTGHGAELLKWWVVPALLFLCGPFTFFALPEHYAAPHNAPMVTSTGSVRSTPFYRWLTLDGNLHLAHHVFPTASWWRLRDADAQLRGITALRYRGYASFYRAVWSKLAVSTTSGNEVPVR